MVHRSSEDSPFEEEPFPGKFPSSLARKDSLESGSGYYQEEFIFYRPPDKDYFEGPFTEIQCQFWYKEGCFYNALEFKFCADGVIETLESLKIRNGRECPFQEGGRKSVSFSPSSELMVKTLMGRVVDLAEEIEKLKEERSAMQISRKLEFDSLTNRVKQLMEKDANNDKYRLETERKLSEMQAEISELKESASSVTVTGESEGGSAATADEQDIAFSETHSISEKTAVDISIGEDVTEVRNELERLQNSIHSLDQFTFKLSHKVEKLRHKYKVVDIIGEGLNTTNGVYDRLAYLEQSMEEIQGAIESKDKEETTEVEEEEDEEEEERVDIVLPVRRENEDERRSDGSIPDQWYSPNEKFVSAHSDLNLTATSFDAASDSIITVAAAVWAAPEKIVEIGEHVESDSWEAMDDEGAEFNWNANIKREEMITPPLDEDTVEVASGETNKENVNAKIEGAANHLELIGKGLGLLLQSAEEDCEDNAEDADIDRLMTAIKGAKMLQIAESLKHHFEKSLICDVCSTGEKKAELRNAIEYFEHLNRSHFKKCGGADRTLVNQFAYLLEQFKAAVPVPMALAKRQYAEREKNKPWLNGPAPAVKAPGKKRK